MRTPPPAPPAPTPGINLIGFISGNLGLGVTARHYLRFMLEAGLNVCPVEVPVGSGRAGHDKTYADLWVALDGEAPHNVNFFVMNPGEIDELCKAGHPAVQTEGRINMALAFWELSRIPEWWKPCLNRMDIFVASTNFVKYAMMADLEGPGIRDFAHPIYIPDGVVADKQRWSIPADKVSFVCSFEMASDVNRKNPYAAIEAFDRAFPGDGPATLIVKVNNPRSEPGFEDHLARLGEFARRNGNIRLFDEVLSYKDVMSLFTSCDVLVSLHRAEGLGLCLMEAMSLGKPVIATGWSGNMDFTTEQNSCLVGYDLVPVRNSNQIAYTAETLRPDARWAEAKIDEAAHWMRRLAAEPDLRERIGVRAAADMIKYQNRIDAGEIVTSIRNVAARRGIRVE